MADDVTMRLETDNGQWQVTIDQTVIKTKKHALLVAKNIKQLARMLPETAPRSRVVVQDGKVMDGHTQVHVTKRQKKKKIEVTELGKENPS